MAAEGSLVYRIVCFSLLDFEFLCGINEGAASIRDDDYIRLKLLRHFDSQLCIHNIKGRSWQRDGAHVRLLTPYGRLVGKVVLSSVLVTISKIDCWIDGRIPTHNRKRRRVGRGRQKWGRRGGGSESIPWVKPLLHNCAFLSILLGSNRLIGCCWCRYSLMTLSTNMEEK